MCTEHFDKAAAGYDRKSRRIVLADKISAAINTLPLSKQMYGMEYGCGTGLVGLAVAPFLNTLTAVDSSQGMLDVLQQKIQEQNINNVQTLCYNFAKDTYPHKQDLIICSMTLHHIKDARGLLQYFTELLNPGGYLAVADIITEDGSFHDPSAEGIHHQGFDPEELYFLLTNFGMENVKSTIVHTIVKDAKTDNKYPVFLLTGRKISA